MLSLSWIQLVHASNFMCELHGTVYSQKTGIPVPNANIQIVRTSLGSASDEQGRFSIINIPPGSYTIRITHIAYTPKELTDFTFNPSQKREVNVYLESSVLLLDSLEVKADIFSERYPTAVSQINIQQIEARRLQSLPGTLDDVIRSVHIFSNVVPASDYTSFFSVRGGSPAENVVIFDGVEIPNPYRFRIAMGGGMSIFDPKIVKNVNVHVGGFPAEYGNFLTSVMEIDIREGDRNTRKWGGALNIMDMSVFGEGPIPKLKGAYIFSARRTFFDLVANRFTNTNSTYPFTTDMDLKLNIDLSSRDRLMLHYLHANEKTYVASDISEDMNFNEISTIDLFISHYHRQWTDQLKQNLTFAWYGESFQFDTWDPLRKNLNDYFGHLDSKIKKTTLNHQIQYRMNQDAWLTGGLQMQFSDPKLNYYIHENNYAFTRKTMPPETDYHSKETFSIFFLNADRTFGKWQTRVGLRKDHSRWLSKGRFSPRINLLYQWTSTFELNASYARCYQYPQVYDTFNRDIPFRYQADMQINPEKADHFNIGLKKEWKNQYSLTLEMYYRKLDELLLPENTVSYFPVNTGKGYGKGFNISLNKLPSSNRWMGSANYSYGISRYQNEHNQIWLPTLYDRRHNFSMMCQYNLMDNWSFSLLWRVASGLPYYPLIGYILSSEASEREFIREKYNYQRYPAYQRLDVRMNYRHQTEKFKLEFYLELINVYNHRNVYEQIWQMLYTADLDDTKRDLHMRTLYMFPFLPSLGFKIEF